MTTVARAPVRPRRTTGARQQRAPHPAGPYADLLRLQRLAGNRAVTAMLLGADTATDDIEDADEGYADEGTAVVSRDAGTGFYDRPGGTRLGTLPLNTALTKDRQLPRDWLSVSVEGVNAVAGAPKGVSGFEGQYGYVNRTSVSHDVPDPDALLWRIPFTGIGAQWIARGFFGRYATQRGTDERFFTNVLLAVNANAARNGIRGQFWGRLDSKPKIKTFGGKQIWIPGLQNALAHEGVVPSGSFTHDVITTVKDVTIGLAAFVAGLFRGIGDSIIDTVTGIVDLAIGLVKSLVRSTIISDIKNFIKAITNLNYRDLAAAGMGWLAEKWRSGSTWDKWHWRGRIIGYALAEIVMTFFSGGSLLAAKAGSKMAAVAAWLRRLPAAERLAQAAKGARGAAADTLRMTLAASAKLTRAHEIAADLLSIPRVLLNRLTESQAAELVLKLPQWAKERFSRLSTAAMRWLLGCHSPCKVSVDEIVAYLGKLAAKGGKRLATVDDVIAALPAKGFNKAKISRYLRHRPKLMELIKEAKLTDTDLAKLADFVTAGDVSAGQAYRTFTRYLTSVVPAKVGKDLGEINRIAAVLVKPGANVGDIRHGAALKGAMFEQWVTVHIPAFRGKGFTRARFDMPWRSWPPFSRPVDKWVPDTGEIWEMKHQLSKVPADQADDYARLVGKALDGNIVKTINYLFPSKAVAELNRHLLARGFNVHYIDAAGAMRLLR